MRRDTQRLIPKACIMPSLPCTTPGLLISLMLASMSICLMIASMSLCGAVKRQSMVQTAPELQHHPRQQLLLTELAQAQPWGHWRTPENSNQYQGMTNPVENNNPFGENSLYRDSDRTVNVSKISKEGVFNPLEAIMEGRGPLPSMFHSADLQVPCAEEDVDCRPVKANYPVSGQRFSFQIPHMHYTIPKVHLHFTPPGGHVHFPIGKFVYRPMNITGHSGWNIPNTASSYDKPHRLPYRSLPVDWDEWAKHHVWFSGPEEHGTPHPADVLVPAQKIADQTIIRHHLIIPPNPPSLDRYVDRHYHSFAFAGPGGTAGYTVRDNGPNYPHLDRTVDQHYHAPAVGADGGTVAYYKVKGKGDMLATSPHTMRNEEYAHVIDKNFKTGMDLDDTKAGFASAKKDVKGIQHHLQLELDQWRQRVKNNLPSVYPGPAYLLLDSAGKMAVSAAHTANPAIVWGNAVGGPQAKTVHENARAAGAKQSLLGDLEGEISGLFERGGGTPRTALDATDKTK